MARRKQQKIGRGKWRVERERCHLSGREPEPSFRSATPIGDIIPTLMKKLGLESEHWVEVLDREWPALAGDAVARHTRPGRLEKGILTVFVDSSVWLSELSRYGKQQLLANLQTQFGKKKVRDVRLQLDPGS